MTGKMSRSYLKLKLQLNIGEQISQLQQTSCLGRVKVKIQGQLKSDYDLDEIGAGYQSYSYTWTSFRLLWRLRVLTLLRPYIFTLRYHLFNS
jgi:hypothetical protein